MFQSTQSRGSALPEGAITNMSETTVSAIHRAASPTGRAVPSAESRPSKRGTHGMTLVEILVCAAILAVALLAIANMFPTAYTDATEAGRRTMALAAARQILEDMHSMPFANLGTLNGFDSTNQATLPNQVTNPNEFNLARRWRYTLAGQGTGLFTASPAEETAWSKLTTAVEFDGSVQVSVAPPAAGGPASPTLRLVTVTVTFAAKVPTVQVATLITQLM